MLPNLPCAIFFNTEDFPLNSFPNTQALIGKGGNSGGGGGGCKKSNKTLNN